RAQELAPGSYNGRPLFKNESSGIAIGQRVLLLVSASSCAVTLATREAEPLRSNEECALKPKDAFKECAKCPEMVVVPAGESWMGSENQGRIDEHPRRLVRIAKPFAVGKFEVTWDEWEACVAMKGCDGKGTEDAGWGRGRLPVINVSWDQAKAYVAWLSRMT